MDILYIYLGLKRTGKSCRLRWLNYLRPDIRRGNITPEEKLLIVDLQARWGNRWSKIAKQMPGRTDNEIKNYWRTRIQRKVKQPRDVGYNNNAYHQAPDGLQKYSNYQNSIVDYPPKPSMLTLLTDEGSTSQTRTIDGEMLIPCTPLFAESGTTHHHQQQLGFPDQNPSLDQSNDGLWGVDDLWSMHLFNNVDLANLPS